MRGLTDGRVSLGCCCPISQAESPVYFAVRTIVGTVPWCIRRTLQRNWVQARTKAKNGPFSGCLSRMGNCGSLFFLLLFLRPVIGWMEDLIQSTACRVSYLGLVCDMKARF